MSTVQTMQTNQNNQTKKVKKVKLNNQVMASSGNFVNQQAQTFGTQTFGTTDRYEEETNVNKTNTEISTNSTNKANQLNQTYQDVVFTTSNVMTTQKQVKYLCEPPMACINDAKTVRTIVYECLRYPNSDTVIVKFGGCVFNKVDKVDKTEKYNAETNSTDSDSKVIKSVTFNKKNNTETASKRFESWPVVFSMVLTDDSNYSHEDQIMRAIRKVMFSKDGGCCSRKKMNELKFKSKKTEN